MKKRILAMLLIMVMALISVPVATNVNAEETITFSKSVTYKMTDARKILDLINEARTEANAEALDGVSNRQPLVIDKALEQAAMLRAAEIAVDFSHTRLDGSSCFTIYPASAGSKGENIAAGSSTYTATHNQWYSERVDYINKTPGAVTGHYTNMIKAGYTRVGIAGCYVKTNDTAGWRYYWVECFGSGASDTTLAAPNDSETTVTLTATASHLASLGLSVEKVQDAATNTTTKAAKTTAEQNSQATESQPAVVLKKPVIKKLKNVKGGKCKVSIKKKIAGTDGYQIRYSRNKSMKSSQIIKLKKNTTLTKTIKGLKKGKTYYVQVRSFKKVNQKLYYSGWSGKKSIRIRK